MPLRREGRSGIFMTESKKRSGRTNARLRFDASVQVSRGEFVYLKLRDEILEGRIEPSQRLREVELTEMFGISRTPIREALKRLEAEGLVEFRSPRGFVVKRLDREQVIELYAMRAVLEGTAARFAAQHASDLEIKQLRHYLTRHEQSIDEPQTLERLNRDFHRQICHAAHNRYLGHALEALSDGLALLRQTTFSFPGRGPQALDEHTKMVDAIEARDGAAAEKAARRHIEEASVIRLQLISEEEG